MNACDRPTQKYPEGRIGTPAGYQAHRDAGEPACRPCVTAFSAKSLARRNALAPDELTRYRAANAASQRNRDPVKRQAEKDRYRSANLAIIREAKSRPCADCSTIYPTYVMQFDHRDPSVKGFNIGVTGPTTSRTRLLAEIAKCDVVCANCHAERTHQQHLRRARDAG